MSGDAASCAVGAGSSRIWLTVSFDQHVDQLQGKTVVDRGGDSACGKVRIDLDKEDPVRILPACMSSSRVAPRCSDS